MATLQDIDDSWDYEVTTAHETYNTGSDGKFNLRNVLEDMRDILNTTEEAESQLEEEFNTHCDRCGQYVGYNKWEFEYNFSQVVIKSPGLCEECTAAMRMEAEEEGWAKRK